MRNPASPDAERVGGFPSWSMLFVTQTALLLAGCSSPVMFRVEVDEAISGGELTLNGNSARLMKNIDGAYWAKWNGSDADGDIVVHFVDGADVKCMVGYVTRGYGTQTFVVRQRKCEQAL